jgi:hypothetical protein
MMRYHRLLLTPVDEETGDMSSPRLLAKHGEIADLNVA